MTKAELVTMVAEKADITKKDAEKAISALVESISETLATVSYTHLDVYKRQVELSTGSHHFYPVARF